MNLWLARVFCAWLFLCIISTQQEAAGTPSSAAAISFISISPEKLDFGSQPTGTTGPPKTATITNTGTSPVNRLDITPSGIDFAQTNSCQPSLAPGASCTIEVRFTAATTGERLGTIIITDSDPGSPHMLVLSGAGD